MKTLTTLAAVAALSGIGFAANAADPYGTDYGRQIEVVPSVSQSYQGFNKPGNVSHLERKVIPTKAKKAVAEFNHGVDAS